MNHQFDELAKSLAHSVTLRAALKKFGLGLAGMALAWLVAGPAVADDSRLSTLIELSRPNAVGTCDSGFHPVAMPLDDATESFVAVNPLNPNNIVGAWIQGPFQNIVAAVSFDGGTTWVRVPLPFTTCAGGAYVGAGDPWLAFAPNGALHCIVLGGSSFSTLTFLVCKSTDGGLTWSAPVALDMPPASPDKTTITADPNDSRFVCGAWVRQPVKNRTSLAFARTTDGGQTWEPARSIFTTDPGQQAFNTQILVLPDGTLVDIFYLQFAKPNQPVTRSGLQLLRSTDKGQTWSTPIPGPAMQTILRTDGTGFTLTVDPDSGALERLPRAYAPAPASDTHPAGGRH